MAKPRASSQERIRATTRPRASHSAATSFPVCRVIVSPATIGSAKVLRQSDVTFGKALPEHVACLRR
jgi:hypothetical protein